MKNKSIFFIVFISVQLHSQTMDVRTLKSINKGNMPMWDKTMLATSASIYGIMPASVLGIWSHGYFTKDKEMMRNGYKSAVTIATALSISTGLKYLINRERPFVTYPNEIIQRDTHVGPFSFPSGHTTSAFATATALSLSYKKWYVTLPSYLYAGLVAYSRMRLGVHYPSDVLVGIAIGTGAGLLTWQLDKVTRKK